MWARTRGDGFRIAKRVDCERTGAAVRYVSELRSWDSRDRRKKRCNKLPWNQIPEGSGEYIVVARGRENI
jgi:hypothetical protein